MTAFGWAFDFVLAALAVIGFDRVVGWVLSLEIRREPPSRPVRRRGRPGRYVYRPGEDGGRTRARGEWEG